MKQLQFYKYAAGVLLLLNLLVIAFFFITRPHPPDKKGREDLQKRAIDIMEMDEQQHTVFLQFAKQHSEQMDYFNKQQRNLLQPYFKAIIDTANAVNSTTLLAQFHALEQKKVELTYQHFLDIKSILNPEQQTGFEEFVERALEIILFDQKKNHSHRRNFETGMSKEKKQ